MTLRLVVYNSSPASASPYRLLDEQDRGLTWANDFLDAQRLRQLSLRSLRAYAYDLLHLARWLQQTQRSLSKLDQSLLLDYVRCQVDHVPKSSPSTPLRADPSTIRDAISATRYLLELFRLQLEDDDARRKLRRLTQRLFNIGRELDHLTAK